MRKIKKRNAQAALEFLLSYGWAILIVLAVIAALAYFGVLSPKESMPNVCQFSFGIACQDFKVEESTFRAYLTNSMGKDIIISNISIAGCNKSFSETFVNGESKEFLIDSCLFGNKGESIGGDFIIFYSTQEGLNKMHQGTIKAKIE